MTAAKAGISREPSGGNRQTQAGRRCTDMPARRLFQFRSLQQSAGPAHEGRLQKAWRQVPCKVREGADRILEGPAIAQQAAQVPRPDAALNTLITTLVALLPKNLHRRSYHTSDGPTDIAECVGPSDFVGSAPSRFSCGPITSSLRASIGI
jgi:hypothetical protein